MKKRGIAFVLSLALSVTLFAGCGNGGGNSGKSEDERTLSVMVYDRGQVPVSEGSYSDNRWTKWVNEQTNMNVKWVPVPRSEVKQSLNVMFASNSAPDIIVDFDRSNMQEFADQGLIQPVGEFIEKYSKDYKEYAANHPEMIPFTTMNGDTYLLTSERETIANHAIWIRQDWLDNLGLKKPETTEELLEVARAFTKNDPDGNGVDDTIGVAFRTGVFQTLFGIDIPNARLPWNVDENGKVYNPQLTDRYKEYLAYRKTFFDEGLIDKEYATDTNDQRQIQAWITGKAGIYFAQWSPEDFKDLFVNDPNAVVVPLEPPATQYGRNGLHQEPPCSHYVAFNTKMKNPELAMEFCDWMIREGYFTLMNGFEGEHYNLVEGYPVPIDTDKNKNELSYASSDMPFLRQGKTSADKILKTANQEDPLAVKLAEMKAASLETALKNKHRQDIPFGIVPDDPQIKQFATEWEPIAEEMETEIILSSLKNTNLSPEQGVEKFRNEWERLGGKEIEELMQKWYDENKDTFQK